MLPDMGYNHKHEHPLFSNSANGVSLLFIRMLINIVVIIVYKDVFIQSGE